MQLILVLSVVMDTIVQLISWFGWSVIILGIPTALILIVFTIRNSHSVQKLTTKILTTNTDNQQNQSTTANTTRSDYITDTPESGGTTNEHNTYGENYFEDGSTDSGFEPISGENPCSPAIVEETTAGTPPKDTVGSGVNNNDTAVNRPSSSFNVGDSGSDEQDFEGVKEPDNDFNSDDVVSSGRSPPTSDDFSSQFDSHQLTDSLTSMQSEDVFESSISDVNDFAGSMTGVNDTNPNHHE